MSKNLSNQSKPMKFPNVRRSFWQRPLLALGCMGITGVACTPRLSRPPVHTATKHASEKKEKKDLQVVFAAPQKLATLTAQVSVVMNQPGASPAWPRVSPPSQ